MKQKISVLLLAVFFPVMVFAQHSVNLSDIASKWKGHYLKNIQKNTTYKPSVKQDQAEKQITSTLASGTPIYTSRYKNEINAFYSSALDNPGNVSFLSSYSSEYNILIDGTMDNDGNWWGVLFYENWGKPGAKADGSLQNKSEDPSDVEAIYKIDKTNGSIVKRITMPDNYDYVGIAFNPVDNLVYFTAIDFSPKGNVLDKKNNQNELSNKKKHGTILYSLNPATNAINIVREFKGTLMGLACSNEGVFYAISWDGDEDLTLVKFTAKTSDISIIGSSIITDEFNPVPFFIDLEIDPSTNKCYMQAVNEEEDDIETAELRLVDLNAGTASLLYTFPGYEFASSGLAFGKADVVPPSNGKYLISSPNGGEKFLGGATPYITWRKTTAVVLGTIQLEYSTNSGVSWTKINNTQIVGVSRYPWRVPQVNSTHCLVRMLNYLSKTEIDRSDREFTIATTAQPASANYPNPFNPSTKISFGLEKAALTSLKIYNSIGQQVAELVNKQLEAGTHEFEFNASNMPSGVYFYNLTSDGKSEVHKMLLMK